MPFITTKYVGHPQVYQEVGPTLSQEDVLQREYLCLLKPRAPYRPCRPTGEHNEAWL